MKIKQCIITADIMATIAVAITIGMVSCGCSAEQVNQAADVITAAKPGLDAATVATVDLPGGVWVALATNIITSIATAIVASRKEQSKTKE